MDKLLYYDKKKHLKVCLIGMFIALLFALNTLDNNNSFFTIQIGQFIYTTPVSGASLGVYILYVLVVIVYFGGFVNGFYWLFTLLKDKSTAIKIICFLLAGIVLVITETIGTITVVPLIIYDIYYLVKMKRVHQYFGRNI